MSTNHSHTLLSERQGRPKRRRIQTIKSMSKTLPENEAANELFLLFDEIPMFVVLLDSQLQVVRASASLGVDEKRFQTKNLKIGDLLHCVYLNHSVIGCGHRSACRSCLLQRALNDTLEQGQSWHQVEAKLYCDRGPCPGKPWMTRLSTSLYQEGEHQYVLLYLEDRSEIEQCQRRMEDYQKRLEQLTRELDHVEERQRQNLAEWLHDDIAQALVFAKMKVQMLKQDSPLSSHSEELENLNETVTGVLDSVRSLTVYLNASLLKSLGLEAAVAHWLDEQVESRHAIETRLRCHGNLDEIAIESQTVLFRCLRELVINAVKHAQANVIEVLIEADSHEVNVCVNDDGRGFNAQDIMSDPDSHGFGLCSIQERASQLGGCFVLDTCPGSGCRAILNIPLAGLVVPTFITQ